MISLLATVILVSAASASTDNLLTLTGPTMGTRYSIRVAENTAELDPQELHASIVARLERVNDQMSNWRPESELSRFNQDPGTDWFPVSQEMADVVAAAIHWGQATHGAFDITVGPLVSLWQFGPEPRAAPPAPEEVAATRARVGGEHLQVRLDPPAVRKLRPDVEVDLSGIAKGFAVDEIARLLDARGIAAYLVEIGGEIRARGIKPDGSNWKIGIETPTPGRRNVQRTIEITGQSLATSGDYRNFRQSQGRRWSHSIDPRTGRPVEHQLVSVTVVADSCMECDALATALVVLGPDPAYDWAQAHNLAALLIISDVDGWIERPTPEFIRKFPDALLPARSPMSTTFWLSLLIFALAMAAMAVGLLGGRRLRGTCGGLSNLRDAAGQPMCDACDNPTSDCAGQKEGRG